MLFETQAMLLSATSNKGQTDAGLHSVQNSEHALVRNKEDMIARCWLTSCWKHKAWCCQQQAQRAGQMLTNLLFKTQSILLLAIGMKVGDMLTYMLFKTQSMLLSATSRKSQPDPDLQTVQKTKSMLLSATSRKSQPDPDLQTV